MPLKLALVYPFLLPLLIFTIWRAFTSDNLKRHFISRLMLPYYYFLSVFFLGAMTGINPTRSLREVVSLAFYSILIIAINGLSKPNILLCLGALIAGQTAAAIHTVLDSSAGDILPNIFLGAVTESGQLSMILMVVTGMLFIIYSKPFEIPEKHSLFQKIYLPLSATFLCAITVLGFSPSHNLPSSFIFALEVLSFVLFFLFFLFGLKTKNSLSRFNFYLATIIFPLLAAATILNLKRGPWAGLFVAGFLLIVRYRASLVFPLVGACAALALVVTPIRERLLLSLHDFLLSGGRASIWQIGWELAAKYPMGIGFRNSPFLRHIDPTIEVGLTHFHSNFINFLAEGGPLALLFFLWWMSRLLAAGWRAQVVKFDYPALPFVLVCAIISWQVAGIVEYSFGDAEVRLVAFAVIGILLGLVNCDKKAPTLTTSRTNLG